MQVHEAFSRISFRFSIILSNGLFEVHGGLCEVVGALGGLGDGVVVFGCFDEQISHPNQRAVKLGVLTECISQLKAPRLPLFIHNLSER